MLQLAINNYYKHINLAIIKLKDINLFLKYNQLKIHNPLIDQVNIILFFDYYLKTCKY